jgi:hypothetical protein
MMHDDFLTAKSREEKGCDGFQDRFLSFAWRYSKSC